MVSIALNNEYQTTKWNEWILMIILSYCSIYSFVFGILWLFLKSTSLSFLLALILISVLVKHSDNILGKGGIYLVYSSRLVYYCREVTKARA